MRPLRICIDARAGDTAGGVQQVVIGLARGLSRLDGPEEYLFLADPAHAGHLVAELSGPCRLLPAAPRVHAHRRLARKARWYGRLLPGRLSGRVSALEWSLPPVAVSDGRAEAAGAAIVHLPAQAGFTTRLPTLYHPHDLQHLHLPEFFTPRQIALRERDYRLFCARAARVVTASSWVKDDLVARYALDPTRVAVVPLAPVNTERPVPGETERAAAAARAGFPEGFALYPAQTWPHKNHLALLEALAILRGRGLRVPLVCSGHQNAHHATLAARVEALGLTDQVRFLGFVTEAELDALYRLARAVVVPSLFEAGSFPVWEAMRAGTPVACSAITSLPRQLDGAGLLFDPRDPAAIADAVRRLWTDEALRAALVVRGAASVARFSWERTARHFRALYREVAGVALREEDRALLEAPPLL